MNGTIFFHSACTEGEVDIFFVQNRRGYPRICRNGIWQYVCNERWKRPDVIAVCQQMGFATGVMGEWVREAQRDVMYDNCNLLPIGRDGTSLVLQPGICCSYQRCCVSRNRSYLDRVHSCQCLHQSLSAKLLCYC